jgi:hypothetical protein
MGTELKCSGLTFRRYRCESYVVRVYREKIWTLVV